MKTQITKFNEPTQTLPSVGVASMFSAPQSPTSLAARPMSTTSTVSPPRDTKPFTLMDARCFLSRDIPQNQMRQDHGYSRVVAEKYGIPAALVLKYLEYRISKSPLAHDGKQWHCQSIAEIATHYPYLSASSIHAALQSIPETHLLRRKIRSHKTRAVTSIYAFADQAFQAQVKSELIYFRPQDAVAFGLHEAVIIHFLQHRIRVKRKKNPDYRFHPVSPIDLAERLKISRASISRAIKSLVEAGVLERNPERSGKLPEYAFTAAHDRVCV